MLINSPWFSAYMRDTRDRLGWTQQQVHDAGGPYRQLQAAVENCDVDSLRRDVPPAYERAYGWPVGYVTALAELGAYLLDPSTNSALHPAPPEQASSEHADVLGVHGQGATTFSELYVHNWGLEGATYPYVGFDVATTQPVALTEPTMSTIGLDALHPLILARHGHTTIDVNLVDKDTMWTLVSDYAGGLADVGAASHRIALYRTGVDDPRTAEPIGIDPLSDTPSLRSARHLAAQLLKIRPHTPTTELRAGFTYAAIAAFGGDPVRTLTEIKTGRYTARAQASHLEPGPTFIEFWREMYQPEHVGWELSQPDPAAADLLAGVVNARDRFLDFTITRGMPRPPAYTATRQVLPRELLDHPEHSNFLFYDSRTAPDLPPALYNAWDHAGLLFHEVRLDTVSQGPKPPNVPWFSIGIVTADDRDVVDLHQRGRGYATLTNFVAGQAIYCEANRAKRISIPGR